MLDPDFGPMELEDTVYHRGHEIRVYWMVNDEEYMAEAQSPYVCYIDQWKAVAVDGAKRALDFCLNSKVIDD